jgi:hypothetical protein
MTIPTALLPLLEHVQHPLVPTASHLCLALSFSLLTASLPILLLPAVSLGYSSIWLGCRCTLAIVSPGQDATYQQPLCQEPRAECLCTLCLVVSNVLGQLQSMHDCEYESTAGYSGIMQAAPT